MAPGIAAKNWAHCLQRPRGILGPVIGLHRRPEGPEPLEVVPMRQRKGCASPLEGFHRWSVWETTSKPCYEVPPCPFLMRNTQPQLRRGIGAQRRDADKQSPSGRRLRTKFRSYWQIIEVLGEGRPGDEAKVSKLGVAVGKAAAWTGLAARVAALSGEG